LATGSGSFSSLSEAMVSLPNRVTVTDPRPKKETGKPASVWPAAVRIPYMGGPVPELFGRYSDPPTQRQIRHHFSLMCPHLSEIINETSKDLISIMLGIHLFVFLATPARDSLIERFFCAAYTKGASSFLIEQGEYFISVQLEGMTSHTFIIVYVGIYGDKAELQYNMIIMPDFLKKLVSQFDSCSESVANLILGRQRYRRFFRVRH
jgi:hypothetical protein